MNGRAMRQAGHFGNWRPRIRGFAILATQRRPSSCWPCRRTSATSSRSLDSGGRKGELPTLTWDKIEWTGERAILVLPASVTKSGKARHVPLTKRSTDILKRLRRKHLDGERVFLYERAGKARDLGNVRKPFETACKRAGIVDFHIHDCRHHFASRLAQRGATLQEIKELMGHASIEMTLRYAHLWRSNLDRAIALLD
jgi:integrase